MITRGFGEANRILTRGMGAWFIFVKKAIYYVKFIARITLEMLWKF